MNSLIIKSQHIKYLRSTLSGSKDKGFRKLYRSNF